MKKILLFILALLLITVSSFAATITATKAGNWTDTTVWDLSRVPADTDDVALAGYDIVWDAGIATIPATGTLASIKSTGTGGSLTIDLDNAAFHSGATFNCTTIQAGTDAMLKVTGAAGDHVLTVNTGTGAGQGVIGGSAASAHGISDTSTSSCTVNVVGNVTGGADYEAYGYKANPGGTINITGNVSAPTGRGFYNAVAATVNIEGNITSTLYDGFYNNSTGEVTVTGNILAGVATGFTNYGAATVTVTGNITGGDGATGFDNTDTGAVTVTGTITGGSADYSPGFYNQSTAECTLGAGSMLAQGAGDAAWRGKSPAWTSSLTNRAKYYIGAGFGQAANTDFPQQLAADQIKSGVISGTVTGTLSGGGGCVTAY